ncbi:very short patch repair endonuclease [Caballeronia sp. 15711]|uniref:very short patch repair endonuclease n=1 Tax=Caballeronia sp. 15711 TaxID=3391029 RepID=UPI0039E48640
MVTEDPEQRSRIMRAVKSRDTAPEMLVRRLVFAMGYRYRLHAKHLPGKPDLVFASRAKVVFVHGCFWHGHHCARGNRLPKNNAEYWRLKIGQNLVRDSTHVSQLEADGWNVLIIWECETKDHEKLTRKLLTFLE